MKTPGKKPRSIFRKRFARVRNSDFREAFQLCRSNPVILEVLLAILEQYREEAIQLATDPKLTDKETHLALGAVKCAEDVRAELAAQLQAVAEKENPNIE